MIDPHWENVVLAMPMAGPNGSTVFTDLKGKTVTGYGNAVITTSQYKFWGSSAYFDGVGDYLSTPDNQDFESDSGNFTIDVWFRASSLPSGPGYYKTILSHDDTAYTRGFLLLISGDDSNKLIFGAHSGTTSSPVRSIAPIQVNTWTQARVDRDGNYLNLYINNVLQQSSYIGTAAINDVTRPFIVGGLLSGGALNANASFHGHINDLRVTKGIARGVEDSSFLLSTYLPSGSAEVFPVVESIEVIGTVPVVGFVSISPQIEAILGGDNAIIGTGEVSSPLASLSASGSSEAVVTLNNGQVRAKIDAISGSGSTSIVGVGEIRSKKDAISSNGLSGEWVGSAMVSSKVEVVVASGRSLVSGRGAIGSTHRSMAALNGHGIVPIVGTGNIVSKRSSIVASGAMCPIGAAIIQGKRGVISSRGTAVIKGVGEVRGPLPIVAGRRHEKVAVATLGFDRGTLLHGLSPAPAIEPIHFTR